MAQLAPNDRLRAARRNKHLSREKLGEALGTSAFTVGRWERGETAPDVYMTARLCELFKKRPEDLGFPALVPYPTDGTADTAEESLPAQLLDPAIPVPAALPLVGRDQDLAELKTRLRTAEGESVIALNGLPGVGKTALSLALAHDAELRASFTDGILWAALGPEPNIPGIFSRWGKLLGISRHDMAQLNQSDTWARAIHDAIGNRRLLLVIDDAWTVEDALTMKVGGTQTAHLVTTRYPSIAAHIAVETATQLQELNAEDSMALLRLLAPQVVDVEARKVYDLVHAVGGLPLALTLVGNYLRLQAYSGQPRRIQAAMKRLSDAEERLHISTPRGPAEQHPSLPSDVPLSLQSIIAVTDQQLSSQQRSALYALAVFPAKPHSFSDELAREVAACSGEILDALSDTGLLESISSDRYTLHQTIADYARSHLQDEAPYTRLIAYITTYLENHQTDYEELERESSIILAALEAAYEKNRQAELIRAVNAFAPFLVMRGFYSLAERHVQRAHEAALAIQDSHGTLTTLLYLGQLAQKQGDFARAEAFFQEGLQHARQQQEDELTCALLAELGSVTWRRGEYSQAAAYSQEGLQIARALGNEKQMSFLLKTLGAISASWGDYQSSETYLREGLELARQSGDREQICSALLNLGVTVAERGNDAQAIVYLREGLELARQIGHREHICALLLNLAEMVGEQKAYDQAEAYLREGLEVAQQIAHQEWTSILLLNLAELKQKQGHDSEAEGYLQQSLLLAQPIGRPRIICYVYYEYGNIYLKQQQIERAEESFQRMLQLIPEGDQEMYAQASFGLARVAASKGQIAEAQERAETSIQAFEKMGHRRAQEIRQWVRTLQQD
ncbi:MAG TPA: tetratricopeptide repeat protein [Ktedonobacteraceae bacterium]|nr:tetratricopeptide repeat protein [Ktedonobacteraceae bacterium]